MAERAPEKAPRPKTDRQKQVREAQKRYRKAHAEDRKRYDQARTRRRSPPRIVGVDGEGQDFFTCKICHERTVSEGGACPKGGVHKLTYRCSRCDVIDPPHGVTCMKGDKRYEAHDLAVMADGHIFTYLAAVDEHGKLVAEAYNGSGLTHDQCCEMLLSIPKNTLDFGFMFSYDTTKIIEQMPPAKRFRLVRPKAREVAVCKKKDCKKELPRSATRCTDCGSNKIRRTTKELEYNGREYDFFNGSFTVSGPHEGRPRTTKVWDCFKFFQSSFVDALKDWSACKVKGCGDADGTGVAGLLTCLPDGSFQCTKCKHVLVEGEEPPVATFEQIERIDAMKKKRGFFDVEDPEKVKAYCREECHLLGRMMRRLIDSHEKARIPLKRYDGAGSTATALLRLHEVAEYKGPRLHELEPALATVIASAFFGGRFEDSVVGHVELPCHGYDISSAYPYALTHMPCLVCGFWRFDKKITKAKLELVEKKGGLAVAHFRVRPVSAVERRKLAWCPLPFRSESGSISYGTNFSGWAWHMELLAAIRGWPDLVELKGGAWIYERRCGPGYKGEKKEHHPFGFLPEVYRERNHWGKEGAGKVLKLGMNASYGKCAQSIGDDPPFQSWIWAGAVTATTRGQLLDAIASAKDRWNVLAVATDGVYALEELPLKEPPKETGTSDMKKPLGGWEHKAVPEGIFLAKPGLYYSLQMKFVRARGIGRRELKESSRLIQEGFAAWDRRDMEFSVELKSRRFYGAKHSIYGRFSCTSCKRSWPAGVPELRCQKCSRVATHFETQMIQTAAGRDAYGTWDVRTIKVAFDPWPKRERKGLSQKGTFCRLNVRDLEGKTSKPYDVGTRKTTPEGEVARATKEFEEEQPDWNS